MKKKFKQICALAAVVIMVLLIILTILAAVIDNEFTRTIFPGLIFTIIMLPIVIYAMLLVYKILKGRQPSDEDSKKECRIKKN